MLRNQKHVIFLKSMFKIFWGFFRQLLKAQFFNNPHFWNFPHFFDHFFDLWKLFSAPYLRWLLPFFQNRQLKCDSLDDFLTKFNFKLVMFEILLRDRKGATFSKSAHRNLYPRIFWEFLGNFFKSSTLHYSWFIKFSTGVGPFMKFSQGDFLVDVEL